MANVLVILFFIFTILLNTHFTKSAADDVEPSLAQCSKILEACKAAGYGKNNADPNKKSIYRDCFSQILNGSTPKDVTTESEDVKVCKAKKAQLKSK